HQNNVEHQLFLFRATLTLRHQKQIKKQRQRKNRYNLLATNFSSFTTSTANLRMPSPVFSYAIAFSFSNQRNLFSVNSSLSTFADFALSGSSLRSSGSVDSESSFISSGLIVRQSHPASSRI